MPKYIKKKIVIEPYWALNQSYLNAVKTQSTEHNTVFELGTKNKIWDIHGTGIDKCDLYNQD